MSNHLKNLVGQMEQEIAAKEEYEDIPSTKKFTVTVRLDCIQMQYFQMLAEKVGIKRGPLIGELAVTALMDTMDQLGYTEEFYNKLKSLEAYIKESK